MKQYAYKEVEGLAVVNVLGEQGWRVISVQVRNDVVSYILEKEIVYAFTGGTGRGGNGGAINIKGYHGVSIHPGNN